jgi:hypothetical protein
MRLQWKSFWCALALVWAASSAHAIKVEGVNLDDQITLVDAPLVLNGAGVRKAYFIKAYVAGMYLPRKSSRKDEIVHIQGPKRFQMVMLMGADSKEFNKALIQGMQRNSSPEEFPRLEARMHAFEKIIDSFVSVKSGDVVLMDYLPGTGTVVSVNGHVQGSPIGGEDFYAKLLEIFIGEHVADEHLKQHLLGK